MKEGERQNALFNWLTTAQVAARLGDVSTSQVHAWVKEGQLRALNVSRTEKGHEWRFKPEWVDAFEARRTANVDAA